MKRVLFLVLLTGLVSGILAQDRDVQLEDSIIGWSYLPKKGPYKDFTSDGFTRTAGQLDHMNRLVEFMMQSYQPVGGTGTFKTVLQVSRGKGNLRPHGYWLDFRIWNITYSQRDAAGKFTGISEEYKKFTMRFNSVGGWLINFLNSPTTSYFTWPAQVDYARYPSEESAGIDPRISATCSPFIVRNRQVVLAKDNKLPFHKVTIGDLLDAAEKAFPSAIAEKKQDPNAGNEEYINKQFVRHLDGIRHWRKVYSDRLNQPAQLRNQDLDPQSFNSDIDPFYDPIQPMKEYYELYKWNDDAFAKAKLDQPLLLAFDIPYFTTNDGIQEHELTTTLQENVNFQYIYDYFFYPEKVKGKPYVPADPKGLLTRLSKYRGPIPEPLKSTLAKAGFVKTGVSRSGADMVAESTARTKAKLGAGEILNEDFASTADGKVPDSWYARSSGRASAVTSLEGLDGKWLRFGINNKVHPRTLPATLPANFTLDLDVATSTEFTSRTGAHLRIRISNASGYGGTNDELGVKDQVSLELDIKAGREADRVAASNFMGSIKLQLHQSGGPNVENGNEGISLQKTLPQFTGNENRRKIHVTLTVKDGMVTVLVDGKKVIEPKEMKLSFDGPCKQCGLPPSKPLKLLNFTAWDDYGEGNVFTYISNVRLVKN